MRTPWHAKGLVYILMLILLKIILTVNKFLKSILAHLESVLSHFYIHFQPLCTGGSYLHCFTEFLHGSLLLTSLGNAASHFSTLLSGIP